MRSPRTLARSRGALGLALALAAAGCDRHPDPVVIQPEFDDATSFESDLGHWAVRTLDLGTPPATVEAVRSSDRASDGAQSVRLRLDNAAAQPKVLLERSYDAEKNLTYSVDVSLSFATADSAAVQPWRVAIGAAPVSPTQSLQVNAPTDTGSGKSTGGFAWIVKTYHGEVQTDASGHLFVYVGVWATSPGARSYYVDDLKVTLTREGVSPPR
jgi:hypothetical protein